jgi:hexulose-6-phosphate isomerase
MALAKDAGFDAIEVAIAEDGEITLNSTEADIRKVVDTARKVGIGISSLATGLFWSYPLTSDDEAVRNKARQVVSKSLQVAQWLGVDAILVVPGAVGVDFAPGLGVVPYDIAYDRSLEALKDLAPQAEQRKVCIAVENVWNKFLLSPLEMRGFIDEIASDYVQVYFDVGNVIATGYPEHWIRILGSRIKRVHFKDYRRNVGSLDGFVDLLEGNVDWAAVMGAFRAVGYDGYVTAEMLPPYGHHPDALIYSTSVAMDYILGSGTSYRCCP